ncbi:MAG: hypothetical protein AAFN77_23190 [Planctomycetota bacterium]
MPASNAQHPEGCQRTPKRRLRNSLVFYTLLLATFAVWFGGFTFYVSIVIPIGTDVLGSARAQGEITQQVADWLNLFLLITIALMVSEQWLLWRNATQIDPSQRPNGWPIANTLNRRTNLTLVVLLATLLLVLAWLNLQLDGMIQPTQRSIRVIDPSRFYRAHQYYLWISTLQWVIGWIWLAFLITRLLSNRQSTNQPITNEAN